MSEMYVALPFPVEIWGTVGQWASSILTAASLGLAWYVILRDRRRVEREHVVKAMCWIEGSETEKSYRKDAHFVNTSEQPVIRPRLVMVPKSRRKLDAMNSKLPDGARVTNMDRTSLLTQKFAFKKEGKTVALLGGKSFIFREDEGAVCDWIIPEMNAEMYDCYLMFMDSNGREWAKQVPGGDIVSARKLASINKRIDKLMKKWKGSQQLKDEIAELKRDKTEDKARAEAED